ncbi:uncharacterized protein LOC118801176 [Colossoma macropomum]|uniref:uncharacterized protein LOC118801176 n=1 Tax=Colossoma macropomum TaxID=42526 RepID=UPI001863FFA6|nr:uncharacterized protein LOC118801176 [Colossoma macropomum]
MAEFQASSFWNEKQSSRGKHLDEIRRTIKPIKGSLTRYIIDTRTLIDGERLKREAFGEKDKRKPHKTILMVGETGTGKSTLINAIVNHMLNVKCNDRIWCEIIETKESQTKSQTNAVTVYDVFVEESPFSLSIIDTPGYGDTKGTKKDLIIAETLHELFRSKDGVHEVDAVCFVVSSNTTRLTDRQLYVFDSILSLFSNDVERNIVVLITHAPKNPTNALKAIKESKVRCAKNDDGKPVYFSFDNSHCEDFHNDDDDQTEDEEEYNKLAWDKNKKNMKNFFAFLNDCKTVSLKMTESVLRLRKQLTASINNLKDRIQLSELRKKEFQQTKAALEEHEKEMKDNNNFEFVVDEAYKEKIPIESKWWHLSKEATCCRVCEENCHYPGCWWVRDLSQCSVMSNGKCTACTGRCDHSYHIKERKIYVLKTRKVTKTKEDLKRKYEKESGEIMSLIRILENEIKLNEREKTRLVEECYQCVVTLEDIALNTDSASTLHHLDFLIEKVNETGKPERVQKLQELKKRAEAANEGLLNMLENLY